MLFTDIPIKNQISVMPRVRTYIMSGPGVTMSAIDASIKSVSDSIFILIILE